MINVLKNLDFSGITDLLLSVIPVLICITVHECCHGLTALCLGDTTAKEQGRLSMNPFKHFDILGFIMLVVVGFGWAKPVPVNMNRFKKPKQGMAITALAGPVSNIILACLCLFIFGFFYSPFYDSGVGYYLLYTLVRTASLSISLAVFNIIPIPPLDGSKVLFSVISDEAYDKLMMYERYGMLLLMLLLFTDILGNPLSSAVANIFDKLYIFTEWGFSLGSLVF